MADEDEHADGDVCDIDEWEEFKGDDVAPIGIAEFKDLALASMPEDVQIELIDDYFPECSIRRRNDTLICEIREHLYTKYWEHKFSAYSFAEAIERAVRRLASDGHPVSNPVRDAEDVHIFVHWDVAMRPNASTDEVVESIKAAHDLVWRRADAILQDSDSVLVLGKDTGAAMDRLKQIAAKLEDLGYLTQIIKEQPDRVGEGVLQKVMRYALSSKFVLIENTEASGHLYEIPHVAKAAECITVVLQEEGKGATWMFEDAYAKHKHWHRITYRPDMLDDAVREAAEWAEEFFAQFSAYQIATLPWMRGR